MGLRTDVGVTHQVRDWGFLDASAQLWVDGWRMGLASRRLTAESVGSVV